MAGAKRVRAAGGPLGPFRTLNPVTPAPFARPTERFFYWSLAEQPGRDIWLFYSVRDGREAIVRDHLAALAAALPQFHPRLCFSQPRPDDQLGRDYHHPGGVDVTLFCLELSTICAHTITSPIGLKRIQSQAQRPLKDAAAVNSTRWALANLLPSFGLDVEKSSGGRTKYDRTRLGIPKDHALDAACVGAVAEVSGWKRPVLIVKAMGRGSHQRTRLDRFGFPRGYCLRTKFVHGFQTGDLVRAAVPKGKHAGVHYGRVAVRATGFFNVGARQGINHQHCILVQRGYGYQFSQSDSNYLMEMREEGLAPQAALSLPGLKARVSRAV